LFPCTTDGQSLGENYLSKNIVSVDFTKMEELNNDFIIKTGGSL
jgi:hypothetical protein